MSRTKKDNSSSLYTSRTNKPNVINKIINYIDQPDIIKGALNNIQDRNDESYIVEIGMLHMLLYDIEQVLKEKFELEKMLKEEFDIEKVFKKKLNEVEGVLKKKDRIESLIMLVISEIKKMEKEKRRKERARKHIFGDNDKLPRTPTTKDSIFGDRDKLFRTPRPINKEEKQKYSNRVTNKSTQSNKPPPLNKTRKNITDK